MSIKSMLTCDGCQYQTPEEGSTPLGWGTWTGMDAGEKHFCPSCVPFINWLVQQRVGSPLEDLLPAIYAQQHASSRETPLDT